MHNIVKVNSFDQEKILFIGDSITACGRDFSNSNSLGVGYVGLFADMLTIHQPDKMFEVINKGIDGNTLGHLLSRWGDDVYEHDPDILSVLIGINDAVRLMDKSTSYHLSPAKYKEVFTQLLKETKENLPNTRILLLEPFYLSNGKNPGGSYRNQLKELISEYIKVVDELSRKFDTSLIPLNICFNKILQHKPSSVLSEDRIHLKRTGHLIIAEEIYNLLFGPKGEFYV